MRTLGNVVPLLQTYEVEISAIEALSRVEPPIVLASGLIITLIPLSLKLTLLWLLLLPILVYYTGSVVSTPAGQLRKDDTEHPKKLALK